MLQQLANAFVFLRRRNLAKILGAGVASISLVFSPAMSPAEQLYQVGVAKVDITPSYPIRLTGYASRRSESAGIEQRLWAKALAVGSDAEKPAILITADNCGVPANVRAEVVNRLQAALGLDPARIAICATHTHSGPWLEGYLPNLFTTALTPEEAAHRSRYTREFADALETVARRALAAREPARLSRGQGQAGFAANRRTQGGPVDHDLPVLVVKSPEGQLRAVFTSYACHCTTLGGEFNHVCGDWAGYAREYFEAEHPGALLLVAIGCAGDANPFPRPGLDLAKQHGRELATALEQVLTNSLAPVEGELACRAKAIELPLETLPSRAEWETRAKETNYLGHFARLNLGRLERGEKLATEVRYYVQSWSVGDKLAMVFLAGEVVVDYSLRLKREFDARRLWINAYANDVPCYIPSERVLREGGYEGGAAMVFYDKPNRFAAGIEDRIIGAVHDVVPPAFRAASENRPPKS